MFAPTLQDNVIDFGAAALKNEIAEAFEDLSQKDLNKVYEHWVVNAPAGDSPSQYDCQVYANKLDWYCDCAESGIQPGEPIVWAKVRGGYAFIG